jgi:hypothetical protein
MDLTIKSRPKCGEGLALKTVVHFCFSQLQKMYYLASYVVGIPTDIYRFFAARRGTWVFQG